MRGTVDPHIQYNMHLQQLEAAIAAGATLDELYKWEKGGYPKWFKLVILAWYKMHGLISLHSEDAQAKAAKRKGK